MAGYAIDMPSHELLPEELLAASVDAPRREALTLPKRQQVEMTPSDYLKLCREVSALPPLEKDVRIRELREASSICVRGGVRIEDNHDAYNVMVEARIAGCLNLGGCQNVESLALDVDGDVYADESGLVRTEARFKAKGDLNVMRCNNLKTLDGTVGGSVYADQSALESLEPGFSFGGSLFSNGCANFKSPVATLPGRSAAERAEEFLKSIGSWK